MQKFEKTIHFIAPQPSASSEARTVILTGEFDDWSASGSPMTLVDHQLGEYSQTFQVHGGASVGQSIQFKFVVDGEWMTSGDYAEVMDAHGNVNNQVFLTEDDLVPMTSPVQIVSSDSLATIGDDPSPASSSSKPAAAQFVDTKKPTSKTSWVRKHLRKIFG